MIFSNTEFYFTDPKNISENFIKIYNEEANHIVKVMRHSIDDNIYVTDGKGNVYDSRIIGIEKKAISLKIFKKFNQKNHFENISFFIPILKSSNRFEFALEKCVELGITNFKIYPAEKSQTRGIKLDRWTKILISAMKQSLHSFQPKIEFVELDKLNFQSQKNWIFEQNSKIGFNTFLSNNKINITDKINLFFGPESGLVQKDIDKISDPVFLKLNSNRLRSETAIITAASILSSIN